MPSRRMGLRRGGSLRGNDLSFGGGELCGAIGQARNLAGAFNHLRGLGRGGVWNHWKHRVGGGA